MPMSWLFDAFVFVGLATSLLSQIVNGTIDAFSLAKNNDSAERNRPFRPSPSEELGERRNDRSDYRIKIEQNTMGHRSVDVSLMSSPPGREKIFPDVNEHVQNGQVSESHGVPFKPSIETTEGDSDDPYLTSCHDYFYRDESVYFSQSGGARNICEFQFNAQVQQNERVLRAYQENPCRRFTQSGYSNSEKGEFFHLEGDMLEEIRSTFINPNGNFNPNTSTNCIFKKEVQPWGSTTHSNHWSSHTHYMDLESCASGNFLQDTVLHDIRLKLIEWLKNDHQHNMNVSAPETSCKALSKTKPDQQVFHEDELSEISKRDVNENSNESNTVKRCANSILPQLTLASRIGIRIFSPGSIIPFHVNSDPYHLSAIAFLGVFYSNDTKENIVASDWPFQLLMPSSIYHDNQSKNSRIVSRSISPGELMFYEGISVVHGRTVPLHDHHYYAQLEVHFSVNESHQHVTPRIGNVLNPKALYQTVRKSKSKDYHNNQNGELIPHNLDLRWLKGSAEIMPSNEANPLYLTIAEKFLWRRKFIAREIWTLIKVDQAPKNENRAKFVNSPVAYDNFKTDLETNVEDDRRETSTGVNEGMEEGAQDNTPATDKIKLGAKIGGIFSSGSTITSDSYVEDVSYSEAHRAARNADLDSLERILTANPDAIHQKDANGWTPLHEAVSGKDTGTIAYLLARGADINAVNKFGMTPLATAYQQYGPHSPIYVFLKRRGAKLIEVYNEDTLPRQTSAHTAAKENNYNLLKLILESDPSACNRRDENGWTPLHEAVRTGKSRLVRLLIESGAEINAKNNEETTPLFFSVQKYGINHSVCKLILSRGARIGDPEDFLAHEASKKSDVDLLEVIHKTNPEWLDMADDNGWRPIHEAARAGMPRVIEFLLDNGVEISSKTRSGDTALTLALQNFDASHPVVKLLQKNSEGNQSQPDEEAA